MGTVKQFPPSQQDLHAFIDDELSPAQRARITQWLSAHPDQRRELLELKLRENLLRTAIKRSKDRHLLTSSREEEEPGGEERNPRRQTRTALWLILGFFVLLFASLKVSE